MVTALVHWVRCCDQEELLPLQTGVLSFSPQSQICSPDSFGVAVENKTKQNKKSSYLWFCAAPSDGPKDTSIKTTL